VERKKQKQRKRSLEKERKKDDLMVHKLKKIQVDFNNQKSIVKAEKLKTALENKGYNLKSTKPLGFDKYLLVYEEGKR